MSIFEKERWEVWNLHQHPYKHSLAEFSYVNDALPGVSNVESALNYILAVLYPNAKPEVATPGDLPTTGNSNGDYRIVTDDGDGRSAGYRWEQREGDVTPSWYKIFDVDWSTEAILSSLTDVTDIKYVFSQGKQDLDSSGTPISGLYAGQRIFGGSVAGESLTLNANSGDGTGAQSGFVQIDSAFRPTSDDAYDLSTLTERWRNAYFSGLINIGTMDISPGSIVDSSGAISFADTALTTTGAITASSLVSTDGTDSATLVPGSYTDTTGAVTFGAAALSTAGALGAGVATFTSASHDVVINPDNGSGRSVISSTQGAIDFLDADLYTTGALNIGSLGVDNLFLDGNTIGSTSGNINIIPDGMGIVSVQKPLHTFAQMVTGLFTLMGGSVQVGTASITGSLDVDNININDNTISATDTDGDITLSPSGTGSVSVNGLLKPAPGGPYDLGTSSQRWGELFLSEGISNGTDQISTGALLALRSNIYRDVAGTIPAETGDGIFFDAVNGVWLASVPDTEFSHGAVSGLLDGDAGHTQFTMLAGRAGGQVIQGGVAPSETLVLESTSDVAKGQVLTKDSFFAFTDALYNAGVWEGLDIGGPTNRFRDVYTAGEFKGFRFENVTSATLPAASVQNRGRIVYNSDNNKALVDTGMAFKTLGVSKFVQDQAMNGIDLTRDVDVSSAIEDARRAQFELLDNANDFEKMYVTLKAISATTIRIETVTPLPVGSYRLIVIE